MRRSAALLVVAALSLSAAACSSSSGNKDHSSATASTGGSGSKVSISIDCAPPAKTEPTQRKQWDASIAAFEAKNPNVSVKSIDTYPCETPQLFTAALKGGTEPNVFYTYWTDKQQVLDSGQAADITQYVTPQSIPTLNDIKPDVLNTAKQDGKLYAIPYSNYTMGLIINKKLFTEAGLDPSKPPTTWAEVATDAKKINALGNGVIGYGDYSAGNNGGWHFTAEMDAAGGQMVTADGKKAAFNNAQGLEVLQNLHDLRFTDNVMGTTQLYQWADLIKLMAQGKMGMFVGAPDAITAMVQNDKASYTDYAMGPIPGYGGPAKGTLAGGNDYMFNVKDTPAQIKAGVALVNWLYMSMDTGVAYNYAQQKATNQAVGLPEPFEFTGATAAKQTQLLTANATMPVAAFNPYVQAAVPGVVEPPNAQAIYKILDTAMASTLTNKNANLQQLLNTAESQVNQVLANAQ